MRARWVGHRVYSEVRVWVPEESSVVEADRISRLISESARKKISRLDRLVVEFAPSS